MTEYRIEVTDSHGRSLRILVRFPASGLGAWRTLDKGFLAIEQGVVDAGYETGSPLAWIALYGGNRVDDSKLALHLDDFMSETLVRREGTGKVYSRDVLLMQPGAVSWKWDWE